MILFVDYNVLFLETEIRESNTLGGYKTNTENHQPFHI